MTGRPAIVFDFGNVIAHFDYRRAGARLGRSLGLDGEAFIERARALGFPGMLRDYEAGGMTSADFHRRFSDLTGLSLDFDDFRAGWVDIFDLNRSIVPVVAALRRRGHRLVLGSNTNEMHAAHFREQFADVFRDFDALVLSHEVGAIKPDLDFYRACVAASGGEPGDSIFIDDLAENVEGARRAGLRAIVYRDTPGLIGELAAMGVEAGPLAREEQQDAEGEENGKGKR